MIIVLGTVKVKSGQVDAALAVSLAHVKRSRTEAGCISHEVSVHAEDPLTLVFVERWADMPALQVHFNMEASKGFVADLTPLLSAAPEMKLYSADEVKAGG